MGDVVVFSNAFANRRARPRRPWATSTRQACRMGRNTGCLSSHPTRRTSRSWCQPSVRAAARGDPAIHQHQLEPPGDALLVEVFQHQLAGPVLVGGGRHDQRTHREAGHVDGHDAFGALRAAVGAAAVVEGEPTVGCSAGQVGVDDHHRRRRFGPAVRLACGRVHHRQRSRPGAVACPAAELRPHPRPGPERLRQEPPLAARVGDVEHRVDHTPQVRSVLRPALAGRAEHRFQQRPLLVGQVTGIGHTQNGPRRLA